MNKDTNIKRVEAVENKVTILATLEVEENAIIVMFDGWRMRVYFDKSLSKKDKESLSVGREVNVEYQGDIRNVHSIKLLPLKQI